MGGISDQQAEWAIVNRLENILQTPPETPFNVTLAFASFAAIILWTKNRAWVTGTKEQGALESPVDELADKVRQDLKLQPITEPPWSLSQATPDAVAALNPAQPRSTNGHFVGMPADEFIRWVRDTIGHGDGRHIRPIHKQASDGTTVWLAGIALSNQLEGVGRVTLHLYLDDLRRIGSEIARQFCSQLSGSKDYFLDDLATAKLLESEPTRG